MNILSINPVNGKPVKSYTEDSTEKTDGKISETQSAWLSWRNSFFRERKALLIRTAEILRERAPELASLMATEMGKPLKPGIQEIEKCALVCDYYAENSEAFLRDEVVATDAAKSYISFQPIGIVLAVMPWNFPFWQVFRFLAPALMAGNCALLKHASNVPGCALVIEDIVRQAGFPAGVFQTLLIGGKAVAKVIRHPFVKAVTLTGSTEAGKQVAGLAASQLKKTVLELGGSDPYVVLEDADVENAARICAQSRLINSGQSCIAAKRFILVKSIEKQFLEIFQEKMTSRVTGDPFREGTDLGPMARKDLRDELHRQVLKNIASGAKCLSGGTIPSFPGEHAYYLPTILTGVKKGMSAYQDEMFGPVAAVISAADAQEAVHIANDTSFGLGAAIFTRDIPAGEKIARQDLQAGSCFVNSMVKSDPRLPFGGINQSGYGRELSLIGIREFVNIKTVYIGS